MTYLIGLATAVPPHELPQDIVLDNARRILGPKYRAFERLAPTFRTSGVERRYSFAPLDWFQQPKDWAERNAVYLRVGADLYVDVVRKAAHDAGLDPSDIDQIVTVSSTGITTPTFEAVTKSRLGLRDDVQRVPVFGLGCAGGVSGLSIAQRLSAARPGTNVLMVAIEGCTLSFRSDRLEKSDIIATVLFGDGASAAIVNTQPPTDRKIALEPGQEHTWPDTLPIMGWNVDRDGLGVVFDRSIPDFAGEHFRAAADTCLGRAGYKAADFDRLVCHPGGAKVVETLERVMELGSDTLDHERDTLRDTGNMSAPTVLFVLERALNAGVGGRIALTALGPGFTASFMPATIEA